MNKISLNYSIHDGL